MSADSLSKISPSGNSSILTYNDIQTRALDSIRIGNFCGRTLKFNNNVFIGEKAGLNSFEVENSVFLGYNAGANIINGNRNIIIGYNYNSDNNPLSNSITIGESYTSSSSTTIGNNNYNYGNSNVILGFYSSNIGTNLFTIGNNLIVKSLNVFYDNGLNTPNLSHYSTIYSNIYNSKTNDFSLSFTSNIQINKKNLITDFINPFLRKDCLIIQGNINIIQQTSSNIYPANEFQSTTTSNISLNQIYNLTNTNQIISIPNNIIRRVASPQLDIITKTISFNESEGVILNSNEYQIKYLVSTPPKYGTFKLNLVDNINSLVYISNNLFNFVSDYCGITPLLIINNEVIKGNEVQYYFTRDFTNFNLTPDQSIILDISKEIKLKSKIISFDVISFDFINIKDKIIENVLNNTTDFSKINVNFYDKPLYGFISDSNRNPIGSINLQNLDNIIYQNYDNTNTTDTFKINFSYGYYFANKKTDDLTVNINIISNYEIKLKDQFIFENTPVQNNIINTNYPTYVIERTLIPINDYYNTHLAKLNGSNSINLNLKLITMKTKKESVRR